jgi:hypothetical protein
MDENAAGRQEETRELLRAPAHTFACREKIRAENGSEKPTRTLRLGGEDLAHSHCITSFEGELSDICRPSRVLLRHW